MQDTSHWLMFGMVGPCTSSLGLGFIEVFACQGKRRMNNPLNLDHVYYPHMHRINLDDTSYIHISIWSKNTCINHHNVWYTSMSWCTHAVLISVWIPCSSWRKVHGWLGACRLYNRSSRSQSSESSPSQSWLPPSMKTKAGRYRPNPQKTTPCKFETVNGQFKQSYIYI